jgi:hypothetical protein
VVWGAALLKPTGAIARRLHSLCRFAEHSAEVNVIGHDEPTGNEVTVFVACVSDEVRQTLLHSWG